MKKILLSVILAGAASSVSFGQGVVVFNTIGGGVNAYVTNQVTGARLSGNGYLAQLYYGAVGESVDSFVSVTNSPARFSTTSPGYILTGSGGGNRNLDLTRPGITAGGSFQFQVRVWEALLGDSFSQALTAWNDPGNANYGKAVLGRSGVFTAVSSATPTDAAKPLTGLTSFGVTIVPEPSVIALGLIGLAALVWRRRQ